MRVKRRVYSGAVCEIEVYDVPDRTRDIRRAEPAKPRFKTDEERERHRVGISRREHNRKFNANVGPDWLYSTLTCDRENELHSLEEGYEEATKLLRRLKYRNREAKIFLYMGRGKRTHRIHFHLVTEGLTREQIAGAWPLGEVCRIEPLRKHNKYEGIDCGRDYTGLANYLFDHWTPGQPGRERYRCTANLRQPEKEDAKEVRRVYSPGKPPRTPKGYRAIGVTDNRAGYLCFKYVVEDAEAGPEARRKRRKEGTGPKPK